ncbi:head-tail connector protein [Testudinibacter sp. TR-2022]|uniref:head-tail connector protein n=1 Tax=Testudinibacter sp. TR-2022 TaxID=2585029 RepID=UPI0011181E33|nr:head-tail connector protein [Testudinibacter sp. TR-2022]TNH06634.1 phage gp6-like head-tail connector protein [Pasteurellaceae bacterium Phil11]TNH25529.1 phage gp6-like head-tail connector protein [Testudinibacter sp. TR-2022]TNH25693.1 phage gp6-like head-tail connector protein [Testudinibacter sp. TR-2022]
MLITLEQIKLHCRIDNDEEDILLIGYANAAQDYLEAQLNRKLYQTEVPENDSDGMVVNHALRHAMLMLVAHWYEHRESAVIGNGTVSKEIEDGAWRLLQPYRIMGV